MNKLATFLTSIVSAMALCLAVFAVLHGPAKGPDHGMAGSFVPNPNGNGAQGSYMSVATGAGVSIYDSLCRGEEPIVSQMWIPDGGGCVSALVEAPALAPFEECHFDDEVNFTVPGTTTSEVIKRELLGRWNGTQCVTPDGGLSTDHVTYSDLGANPLDASASIQAIDGSIVTTTCTGAAAVVRDSRSGVRCQAPWQGNDASAQVDGSPGAQAVLQVWPNLISPFIDASTPLVITTTYGGAIGATAATIGGVALTNVQQVAGPTGSPSSIHQVSATLPPAPAGGYQLGDAGAVAVTVTATNNPASCAAAAGCFAFGASGPTITSVSPPYGPYEGGITVTITGTGFGTTGSPLLTSLTPTGGSTWTSISVTNGTTATAVTSTGPSTNGGVVGLTANGGGTLANAYGYTGPINNGSTKGLWHDANYGTTIATGVSSWTELSGSGFTFAQATGGLQMTLTANWLSSGKAALTSNGSQYITTSSNTIPFTSQITVCQVRDDSGAASKEFIASAVNATVNSFFESSVGSTGTYGVVVTGSGQNYGNGTSESRSAAIHNYCFTFDNTVGAALSTDEYIDGVHVASYTSGATPATSSANFVTGQIGLFHNGLGGAIPTGDLAINYVSQNKWNATQMTNAEAAFKKQYAALP